MRRVRAFFHSLEQHFSCHRDPPSPMIHEKPMDLHRTPLQSSLFLHERNSHSLHRDRYPLPPIVISRLMAPCGIPHFYTNPRPAMLTWSQSVRHLNREYRLTMNALQQIKDYFQEAETTEPVEPIAIIPKEELKIPSLNIFSPPKLVRRMELKSFPILSIVENDELDDSMLDVDPTLKSSIVVETTDLAKATDQSEEETTYTVETFYRTTNNNPTLNPSKNCCRSRKNHRRTI